jgi:hypothetical protein
MSLGRVLRNPVLWVRLAECPFYSATLLTPAAMSVPPDSTIWINSRASGDDPTLIDAITMTSQVTLPLLGETLACLRCPLLAVYRTLSRHGGKPPFDPFRTCVFELL